MPLSRNYYDDLVSRVSLAHLSSTGCAGSVLRDNTGGGDYFHAYTEAFEGFHSRSFSGSTTTAMARPMLCPRRVGRKTRHVERFNSSCELRA